MLPASTVVGVYGYPKLNHSAWTLNPCGVSVVGGQTASPCIQKCPGNHVASALLGTCKHSNTKAYCQANIISAGQL